MRNGGYAPGPQPSRVGQSSSSEAFLAPRDEVAIAFVRGWFVTVESLLAPPDALATTVVDRCGATGAIGRLAGSSPARPPTRNQVAASSISIPVIGTRRKPRRRRGWLSTPQPGADVNAARASDSCDKVSRGSGSRSRAQPARVGSTSTSSGLTDCFPETRSTVIRSKGTNTGVDVAVAS